MQHLNPRKLHVTYLAGATPDDLIVPRRYTLTHSDVTGKLFLSVGSEYDTKQISKLYTRLMRDEVLAEFVNDGGSFELRVHCHISGGLIVGSAGWRYNIFRSELPLVLEAIRYGDKALFEKNPEFDHIPVCIHFHSNKRLYNVVEQWGTVNTYAYRD
jgi:hypothetical protein